MVGEIRAEDKTGAVPTAPAGMITDRPDALDRTVAPPADRDENLLNRVLGWVARHPFLVVAVGAGLVAIGQAAWIWTHRHLGAYDPDESGYIGAALRMQRSIDPLDPLDFVFAVGGTGNGIVTPLLSVPLVVLGPRDPRTAMLVQPLLMVALSISVAGITRRLAGAYSAIAAGLLVAVLPTTMLATQSYWYGLSAAACMAGAMWALVTSDRCDNRRIWLFGLAVGLMWLSRTMTLGYAPAVLVAGVVVAGWDRRRLLRLAGSLALAVGVAFPWYFRNRDSIFGYLLRYGYGDSAAAFGSGGPWERTGFRIGRITEAFGFDTIAVLVGALVVTALIVLWRRRGTGAMPPHLREWLAVAAAFVTGMAALISTTNSGVWFELPLVVIAVPLLVSGIAAAPRWVTAPTVVVVGVFSVQFMAQAWWLVPHDPSSPPSHYEYGFAEYDERFAPTRRPEQRRAAEEWWHSIQQVELVLRELSPEEGDAVFTLTGNMVLFNSNSLMLAGELDLPQQTVWVPDTTASPAARAVFLTPTVVHSHAEPVERILLVAVHDQHLFHPDIEVDRFTAQALDLGWRVTTTVPMPDGSEVQILRHPDGS